MSLPARPTLTAPFHDKVFKNKSSSSVSSTVNGSDIPPFEQLVLIGAAVIQLGIVKWSIDLNDSMQDLTELGKLTNRKPFYWGKLYKLRGLCSTSSISSYAQTGLLSPLPSPPVPGMALRSNGELFRAYVGALFLEKGGEKGGLLITNQWIRGILEHEVGQGTLETAPDDDESSGMSIISPLSSPTASKTPSSSPTAQNIASGTGGPSSGDAPSNELSKLNELIARTKGKHEISWRSSSEGVSHDPTWTMELSISGYQKTFKGVDKNKKTARLLAAVSAMKDRHLGETVLEIYTHKSLSKLANIKDNERYALLGAKAFEVAVTDCVFKNPANYSPKEMEEEVKKIICEENFQHLAACFSLREKLRYNPADKEEVFTPDGAREVFLAYIGGVYSQPNGHQLVEAWVANAFFPSTTKSPEIGNDPDGFQHTRNNYTDVIHPPRSGSPPMLPLHKPRPSPLDPTLFPLPPDSLRSGYSSPPLFRDIPPHMNPILSQRQQGSAILPKFNEITTRRRYDVQWHAEQTGMQHAPMWKIDCVVNGHIYGSGIGSTKQLAKEEAAKEAFLALDLPQIPTNTRY